MKVLNDLRGLDGLLGVWVECGGGIVGTLRWWECCGPLEGGQCWEDLFDGDGQGGLGVKGLRGLVGWSRWELRPHICSSLGSGNFGGQGTSCLVITLMCRRLVLTLRRKN